MTQDIEVMLEAEIKRVKEEVLPVYLKLPVESGSFGCMLIRCDLQRAEKSLGLGNEASMMDAYKHLHGWEL